MQALNLYFSSDLDIVSVWLQYSLLQKCYIGWEVPEFIIIFVNCDEIEKPENFSYALSFHSSAKGALAKKAVKSERWLLEELIVK